MSFDFDAAVQAPFRMQPGLRRLADGVPHLTPAAPGSRHQREKLAVLSRFWPQALLVHGGFDETAALHALLAHAATEHPQTLQWDGRSATALGVCIGPQAEIQTLQPGRFGQGDEVGRCLAGLPPRWRLAGLLALAFEDDLALVRGADASIPWLAVALPSHWAPEEKIGRHFAAVHAPVADNRLLLAASDSLMRLVTSGERWERFVWTITGHPRLHAHPDRVDPQRFAGAADPEALSGLAWWRTERQSFIPLPALPGHAVFTIRIAVTPLREALADAQRARQVHDALASMSDEVISYRGLREVRPALLAWLSGRAQPAGPAGAERGG
ncbi:MAG: DUF3445 domain-containing protein [Rubrivivax sp.]|nr:DUF3445 domain-containing protein [Rubrivivax sp.]